MNNDFIPNITEFSKKPAELMLEFTGSDRETDCLQSNSRLSSCTQRCWRWVTGLILLLPIGALCEPAAPQSSSETTSSAKVAGEFELQLNIENGHIGHVIIGCKKGATDGFDSRIDDMAPPPGMGGTGYTFLVSPDRKYNLYRDIRGISDTVQWVFYAKTGVRPVTISWESASIPEGWDLRCGVWDGKSESVPAPIDGKTTTSIQTKRTCFIRFWITRTNSGV